MKYAIVKGNEGPAYGVGLSPELARKSAEASGFGDAGSVISITDASYEAVLNGDPDGWVSLEDAEFAERH